MAALGLLELPNRCEQLLITGSPEIAGQVIVENAPSVDDLAIDNSISGSPTVTYNGGFESAVYRVTSWRDVR